MSYELHYPELANARFFTGSGIMKKWIHHESDDTNRGYIYKITSSGVVHNVYFSDREDLFLSYHIMISSDPFSISRAWTGDLDNFDISNLDVGSQVSSKSVIIDGETVTYYAYDIYSDDKYLNDLGDPPYVPVSPGYSDARVDLVYLTLFVHGNPGVTQAIPVQWRKPGGVLLQTSFDITVH